MATAAVSARSAFPVGQSKISAEQVAQEQDLIREAVNRVIAGDSLRGITKDWNERGITTSKGHLLFGRAIPISAAPGTDPVAQARTAEALGFDFVSTSDHLHGNSPMYEPWTMLSWIAAATSRIRVGTRVLAVPYRHPAVLAKMAETFDRLAGWRLILGLGGGFADDELFVALAGSELPGGQGRRIRT